MKRTGMILAAALVLVTNALVLLKVARNRSGAPTASIELTERELRLVRPQKDSTALFLKLEFDSVPSNFKFEDGPGWFNQAKLEELGYDCRLPLTDPSAAKHYWGMPARAAFVVLEFNTAEPEVSTEAHSPLSRLRSVDAGRDSVLLRAKYPDAHRHLIVPALVRLVHTAKWDDNTHRNLEGAYLRGAILQLLVNEISVPPAGQSVLEHLAPSSNEYFVSPQAILRGPRYSVVLKYGQNYEPWIESVRILP